jgi:NitT/TauT family transport system ATP-binding protein
MVEPPEQDMSDINVEGLSLEFGSGEGAMWALRDVTFSVESGEFMSIVGPSGCGKTTLLRILSGALRPSEGRVILGEGAARASVYQEHSLLPWRTVIDNVAFGLEIRGLARRTRHQLAREYIELVGLSGFENTYPYQLSGGMKQRANLARALSIEPALLLMDEPFASVDSQTRELMQAELLRIWEQTKKTVVFITHQIEEAVYLSDRVIVFSGRPGRVKAELPITIDRPRSLEVKRTMAFVNHMDQIWKQLESDVSRRQGWSTGGNAN